MNKEALLEAIKELARLFVLAIIPVVIDWLGVLDLTPDQIALATAVLRAIDKWLHEIFKERNTTIKGIALRGIAPF